MLADLDRTIAAQASASGAAERAIVRISGRQAAGLARQVFTPDDVAQWNAARLPRRFPGSLLLSEVDCRVQAAALLWPGSRSYTGQPMVEIHLPGSPPLVDLVLKALFDSGVRPAGRGEFTLRAFLAGRLDLVQAEAVLAVIDASDSAHLTTALRQLAGGLSGQLLEVRGTLVDLLADLEAGLDFVEEDIEFISASELVRRLTDCRGQISSLEKQAESRFESGSRKRVVLAGLPNAGKSTLLNRLAGAEAAIVSERPGTTRDYVTVNMTWDGLDIELVDTAGWELTTDGIMSAAQQLREKQMKSADLIIWCTSVDLDGEVAALDQRLKENIENSYSPVMTVLSRCDLGPDPEDPSQVLAVSGLTGHGLDPLRQQARQALMAACETDGELVGSTAARCRNSLDNAGLAIDRAILAVQNGIGDELVAVELQQVLERLGEILGNVHSDDILGRIFSRFCIGK